MRAVFNGLRWFSWWIFSVDFVDFWDLFLIVVFLGFSWCSGGMVFKALGTGTTVIPTSPYI